jgi:DNA-binding beta-propeller fold protein YncE/mono/diheme cytochrome c family protein
MDTAKNKFSRAGAGLLILATVAIAMFPLIFARAAKPDKTAPPKYLSPIAMVADKAGKTIYIAQATAGQIAVFDVATRNVTANIDIGLPVSGVAISPDGTTLYVTAGGAEGKLCEIDIKSRKVTARIPVGHTPMSPVVGPEGKKAYLANRFGRQTANRSIGSISVVDLAASKEIATARVPREPTALDISKDGKTLIVANHLPATASDQDYAAAEVTIMDMTGADDDIHVKLPNGSMALRGLKISPDGKFAAVTHLMARFHLPTTALERGWMNTNAFSLIDVAKKKLINTILLDDVDHGAANPWAIAWSANSETLCISHAGTREISVIDMPALQVKLDRAVAEKNDHEVQNHLAFLLDARWRLKLAGNGPRSMVIIGKKAYIGEYFTDSLSIVDISAEGRPKDEPKDKYIAKPQGESIALGPKTEMTTARRGEMLFNDASKMCFQMWQSCASCHPDGRTDGLNWDMMGDGMGNPKSTKSMLLSHKTPPAMITGIRTNAKIAVMAKIRFVLFAVRPQKDALAIYDYIASIKPTPSPLLVDGKLSPNALRGKKLFKTAKCASCHSGKLFTDLKRHDVGTGKDSEAGKEFDTPTLMEVWRTAPYLLDGRAVTILDVLSKKYNPNDLHGKTSDLTRQERSDLAKYVMSL